jgi:hypothetical protein
VAEQSVPDSVRELIDSVVTKELVEAFEDAETLARVRHARAGLRGWDLRLAEVRDAIAVIAPHFVAAGRAQAAADIRAHLGPDPSPANPAWWAGYTEALSDCARLAEGPAAEEAP